MPFLVPAGREVRRLDDGVDAPIANVPPSGVPLETSDANDAFAFAFGDGIGIGFVFGLGIGFGDGFVFGDGIGFGNGFVFGDGIGLGEAGGNPTAADPRRRRPPDPPPVVVVSTPFGEKKSKGGGESGVSIDGVVSKDGTVENEVEDDGLAAPPVAARLFAARLDASLDADDAPSDPVGERAALVAVGRRRCDPDPDGEGPSGEVDE